jgi:hypothetical protein
LFFILRKIDPETDCWLQQCQFEVLDLLELQEIVSTQLPEPMSSQEIEGSAYSGIVKRYSLPIEEYAEAAELECCSDESLLDPNSHTGRELLLMLKGRKPLAAFVEVFPDDMGLEIIPERQFELHVREGRIKKYEYHIGMKGSKKRLLRRVLYSITGEEWRFQAHEMLWRSADKHGWKEGFELMEGFLLGYEVDVDPFYLNKKLGVNEWSNS